MYINTWKLKFEHSFEITNFLNPIANGTRVKILIDQFKNPVHYSD